MNEKGDAFLFSGQGSQYVGMGADLHGAHPHLRALFDRADTVLGQPLSEIMFTGPEEALTLTRNTQPAILALSMVHHQIALSAGLKPAVALGHSLGEYSAWVAAGSIAYEDALKLVRLRGEAMQEAVPVGVGGMSAIISAAASEVEALCAEVAAQTGQVVSVSVYNCPGNTVVSGHAEAVEALEARVGETGIGTAVSLKVSAPFHCALLAPAAERLKVALDEVEVSPNTIPVIPNVIAEVVPPGASPESIRGWLVRQVVEPVRWEASLRTALGFGVSRALSLGPGKALRSHMKRVSRRFPLVSLDDPAGREALKGEKG